MISNWLKVYWYNTRRNAVYFLLTVLGLAIGLSAMIISYLYYDEERSYDSWHPNEERIFSVVTKIADIEAWASVSYPYGDALKSISSEVEAYCYQESYYRSGMAVVGGVGTSYDKAIFAESSFFELFPFEIVQGSAQLPFDGPKQVYVLDTYVPYLFKDKEAIGETISLWGEVFTVKGVFKQANTLSSIAPNLVFNVLDERVKEGVENEKWGMFNSSLWLKLKDENTKEDVESLLNSVYYNRVLLPTAEGSGMSVEEFLKDKGYSKLSFSLVPLKGQRLVDKGNYGGALLEGTTNVNRIYIALSLSGLLLLLSIFNYVNITTVQVMNRGKEVGMRKTLGAGRLDMMLQNYFESTLTVILSIAVSIVIIENILPSLRVFLDAKMTFSFLAYSVELLLFALVIILLVGTVPALYLSSFETVETLKGAVRRSKKGTWFKNSLLVVQFLIACFFITGSIVMNRQIDYMLDKDLGYDADQVVGISFNLRMSDLPEVVSIYERLKTDVLKVNGVEDVTAWTLGIGGQAYSSVSVKARDQSVQLGVASMDYNLFDLYDMRIKEGRKLSRDLASDSINNVLLNEKAVEMLGIEDVVGKEIDWNESKVTVVGVVEDFNLVGLDEDYRPMLFLPLYEADGWGSNLTEMSVKLKAEHAKTALEEIEKIWEKHNVSDYPFSYEFIDKRFAKSFEKIENERKAFLILNLLVVFIALFGLFSLASFTIGSRLKEIAIRKVLGADTGELIRTMILQYVIFCLLGFFLSIFPSYYFLEKWLSDYAFRIEIGVLPYVICLVIILVLTISIVFTKAYQATKVDVVKYIKYE